MLQRDSSILRAPRSLALVMLPLILAEPVCGGSARGAGDGKPGVELVQNGGFEEPGKPVQGWVQTDETRSKGTISRDETTFRSGRASLKLQPNGSNGGDQPLSISSRIPGGAYRGSKLRFSGYLRAEGGATAVLGMLSVAGGRPGNLVLLTQGTTSSWVRQEGTYDVPDDPAVILVLLCSVSGQSGAAYFDDLSVMSGSPPSSTPSAPPSSRGGAEAGGGAPLAATVDVDASRVVREIPPTLYGTHVEWVYNAYGLWQEREQRADPEIERLTRELGVTLIRFPGGFLADFYHWRDGVGPVEKRPEALHQAGTNDRSRPTFGTDEAIGFARSVGAELLITVNAGTGTPEEAADWVRYVNAKELRVRHWEVGNELYIRDGSAISKATTIDPATYAARFRKFADAMRAADPRIKVGAIGGENEGRYALVSYPDWCKVVLEKAGDAIDFLAVHNAYAPVLSDDRVELREAYRAMLAAPTLIRRNLDRVADQIARYAPKRSSAIEIAVTEWGPLFQADPNGRYIDHNKTLGSALFAASTLKALIESPHVTIANFHELNDLSMLGWISSKNGDFPPRPEWAPTARYFAFQLFTRHFGNQLVASEASGPTYDSTAVGSVDAVKGVPYLDVLASLGSQGGKLHVIAINREFDRPIETTLKLRGFAPRPRGQAWTLTGTGIDANTGTTHMNIPGVRWARQAEDERNPRFSKGAPGEITLGSAPVDVSGERFTYVFPPRSVTALELDRR
jgi:alpha-N-arabinofuranosidase